MTGKSICKCLKSVRRAVAEANGIDLEIPVCTFEGECSGTCPQCEAEVQMLEKALSSRKRMAQKVAVVGVAAGLSFLGGPTATAQNITPTDSVNLDTITIQWIEPTFRADGTVTWTNRNPVVLTRCRAFDRLYRRDKMYRMSKNGAMESLVKEASFPGGLEALDEYIEKNQTYPDNWVTEGRLSGVVVVEFMVKADGRISRVKTVKGVHSLLDAEAERLVANMPRWKPTIANRRKVSAYYEISIRFLPR